MRRVRVVIGLVLLATMVFGPVYAAKAEVPSGPMCTVSTRGDTINLRAGPGTSYAVTERLSGHHQLDVIAQDTSSGRAWYLLPTQKWVASWVVNSAACGGSGSNTTTYQAPVSGTATFSINYKCDIHTAEDPRNIPAAGCNFFTFEEVSNNFSIGCHDWSACGQAIYGLTQGDQVEVNYGGQSYRGTVVAIDIVRPSQGSQAVNELLGRRAAPTITLFTCQGDNRRAVRIQL
jgi:hypothetical protein